MKTTEIKPESGRDQATDKEKTSIASACVLQAAGWLYQYSQILNRLHPVTPVR